MTGIRLLAAGLRLVALWLLMLAIQSIGVVLAVQKNVDSDASYWWAALPASIFLAFAIIIWLFPRTIAAKLYGPEKAGETFRLSPESLLRVGCCLLGLWTFSTALPAFGRIFAVAVIRAGAGQPPIGDSKPYLVHVLVQLAVAFALLFRNRAIYVMALGAGSKAIDS